MLERRSYRGEFVDIFSIGVILFVMVTGSLPYHTEATTNDPLYKLIYMKKRNAYWKTFKDSHKKSKDEESVKTSGLL